MAERFYFELENAAVTLHDPDGVEAANLEEALHEARSVIAEMAGEIADDHRDSPWTLLVRDESGWLVGRLPIRR